MNIVEIKEKIAATLEGMFSNTCSHAFYAPFITSVNDMRATFLVVPGMPSPSVAATKLLQNHDSEYHTELIILVPETNGAISTTVEALTAEVLNQLETALRSVTAKSRIVTEGESPDRLVRPTGFGGLTQSSHPKTASDIEPMEASLAFYANQGLSSIE